MPPDAERELLAAADAAAAAAGAEACAICLEGGLGGELQRAEMPCCARASSTIGYCTPCIRIICQRAPGSVGQVRWPLIRACGMTHATLPCILTLTAVAPAERGLFACPTVPDVPPIHPHRRGWHCRPSCAGPALPPTHTPPQLTNATTRARPSSPS